ncbi:MAG: family 16 glycoside hydrolase [Anaerolineae bacterium]
MSTLVPGRTTSSWKWVAGIGGTVVVVVGLVIALASGGKPAVPPTSTPGVFVSPLVTPMPTSTLGAFVSPLGTPTSGAFVSPLSTPTPRPVVLYSDDFSDPESGWYEGSLEDKEYHYEKGEYVILVKKNDLAAWASWPKERFADFTLEADVRLVEGPKVAEMGLVFRLREEGNFYFFRINGDGQYMVGKDVNGQWQAVAGMGIRLVPSPHIKTEGATNRLKVVCQGPQIALYVNGHHLTTLSDDSFAEGKIGLIAAAIEYSEPVKVAFDNLVVSAAEDIP